MRHGGAPARIPYQIKTNHSVLFEEGQQLIACLINLLGDLHIHI
jgi:hypothetical protein